MVLPVIPLAAIALLALIAVLIEGKYISSSIRDISTGESTEVEVAEEETKQLLIIELGKIYDNPNLTDDQKYELYNIVLKTIAGIEVDPSELSSFMNKAAIIIFVVVCAYLLATYMKSR